MKIRKKNRDVHELPAQAAGHADSRGFGLFEALLSVAIGTLIITGGVKLAADWSARTQDRLVAKHLMTVHKAAEDYVNSKFMDIWVNGFGENPGDTNGDGALTNADLSRVGAMVPIPVQSTSWSTWFLRDATGTLPSSFPEINVTRQGVTVFVRNLGIVGGKRTMEILTATLDDIVGEFPGTGPLDEDRLMDIAQVIGPEAGIVTAAGTTGNFCTSGVIRAMYGNWQVQMADYQTPSFGWGYCPTITPTGGGYIAAYGRVSYEDTANADYLYRVAIPGQPELNRMQTNLDMNGYDLLGAHYFSADNVRINGALSITGDTTTVKGRTGIGLIVDEMLRVEGDYNAVAAISNPQNPADRILDASGRVIENRCAFQGGTGGLDPTKLASISPSAIGPCYISGGQIVITGKHASPGHDPLVVQGIYAPEATITAQNINVNSSIDISADTFSTGNLSSNKVRGTVSAIETNTLTVTNNVNTPYLEVQNLSKNSAGFSSLDIPGDATMTSLNVRKDFSSGPINVAGSINAGSGTAIAGSLDSAGSAANPGNMDIKNLGGCTAVVQSDGGTGFVTVPEYDCMP